MNKLSDRKLSAKSYYILKFGVHNGSVRKNGVKAMHHALYGEENRRKVKITKINDSTQKPVKSQTDDINAKLAAAQKAAWAHDAKTSDKILEDIKKTKKSDESENSQTDEKVIKTEIRKKEPFNIQYILALLGPGIIAFSRTPLGKRFLVPAITVCCIPIGFILYYLFENNRQLSESDQTVYNTKSVMELRSERQKKSDSL